LENTKSVYQTLDAEFKFDHDPCPPEYTVDGLQSEWGNSNFINPPYGRELPKWVAKAYAEHAKGKTCVMLYQVVLTLNGGMTTA
jgi:hypothetical protein